ncbi:sulfatase-like hydrolase/transferase [Candidatus Fermentibacteria bacterium]|nr:sulfatase-like hydrolase/transferase [Candidatus Fermentibacteria bacterium]
MRFFPDVRGFLARGRCGRGEKRPFTTFLFWGLVFFLVLCGCGREERPNILLVLIDTIRADHVGCYGYHRATTPNLDSLAEAGTRFSRVMSGSPWTLPSMTSIFTGMTERTHRARLQEKTFYGVDLDLPFLSILLSRHGYNTAAFFNVIYMSEHFNFHRGFDHFDCEGLVELCNSRTAGQTVDALLSWLDGREEDEPFFVAIHFFDPHATYDPPAPYDTIWTDPAYDGRFDSEWGMRSDMDDANSGVITVDSAGVRNLVNLYDGELAYTDAQLGRLMQALRAKGLANTTLVIVIGDHGEEFADHGKFAHGHTLHAELLQVPLILAGCGVRQGRVDTMLVSNIDIMPTVLSAARVEVPDELSGRNLLSPSDRSVRTLPASGLGSSLRACVRRLDTKVIWDADTDSSYMYDQASDSMEMEPLRPDSALLAKVLEYWATPPEGKPDPVPWTNAVEQELRDLGYVR